MDRETLKEIVREVLISSLGPAAPRQGGGSQAGGSLGGMGRPGRRLVVEADVLQARQGEREIELAPGTLVTPLARESAARYGVRLVEVEQAAGNLVPPGPAAEPRMSQNADESGDSSCARGVVALGADHAGYRIKETTKEFLEKDFRCRVIDVGTHGPETVDYPEFAHRVAALVARGEACRGILVDGAGIGSAMVANRHPGVRAARVHGILEVISAREHNNANVLCLGSGFLGEMVAQALVATFLTTPFAGGRHARRVAGIERPGFRPSREAGCTLPA